MENKNIPILHFYRFLAAIFVVLFHYKIFYATNISKFKISEKDQPFYDLLYYPYEFGWMAVQFFFFLSGFVFYLVYLDKINEKKINFRKFFLLRFSRLYPLHFATLLTTLTIFLILDKNTFLQNIDIKHFILNLFLIQNWGIENGPSFNEPSWSISIEAMMYLTFFLVAKNKNFILHITVIFIIIFTFIFFEKKLIGYGGFCFFLGGIVFLIYEKIKNIKMLSSAKFFSILFLIFLLTMVILRYSQLSSIEIKILIIVFLFPTILLASTIYEIKNKKVSLFFNFLGNISYSTYLLHFPVQIIILSFLKHLKIQIDFGSQQFFLSYIFFIILLSSLSYIFYENKIKIYIRKKI
jgi:peptidoglycan/LPS O-acetylase OafA/YrhL